MQPPFSCVPTVFAGIERALSPARLSRYLGAAGGDKHFALRLYIWNARLCEEFYIPLQFAEVSFRNALSAGLMARFKTPWYDHSGFFSGLPVRLQEELDSVIRRERIQHRFNFNSDHVVSGMSIGFWLHLCTKDPINLVWKKNLKGQFANIPDTISDQDIYNKIDKLRIFRNKIAHHDAIFDKEPLSEYSNIEDVINWSSPETLWFIRQISSPSRVINNRPAC